MSNYKVVFLIALFYAFFETAYFGWNAIPQSPEEVICDGIAFAILAMGFMTKAQEAA